MDSPQPDPAKGPVILKSLRTFQGDVAEAMKKQNASVLSIALAEQNKPQQYTPPAKERPVDLSRSERVIREIPGSKPLPRPKIEAIPEQKIETIQEKMARISEGSYQAQPKPRVPQEPKVVLPVLQAIASALPAQDPYRESVKPERIMVKPQPVQSVVFKDSTQRFDPDFKKNILTIVASIVLILLGIGSVIGFYMLQKNAPSHVITVPVESTIIPFDTKQKIVVGSLDREAFIAAFNDAKTAGTLSNGQVMYTALVENDASSSQILVQNLFSILQTSAPAPLLRAMDGQFMMGYYEGDIATPFLLIGLSDFDNAYSGMLAWEKTMNDDIGVIFSPRSIPIAAYVPTATTTVAGLGTTTVTEKSVVNTDLNQPATFKDVTIQDKDARVLQNFRGDPILLYSFLDNNTLLITSNETTLTELLNKLIAAKLVH